MDKPDTKDLANYHRYFAIHCNNEFWDLSERELDTAEKQKLLSIAYSSLYHWQEVGTDQNVHHAILAVARAHCINESMHSVDYASQAFDYFDGSGENWIQALTNAVLSHALYVAGNKKQSTSLYENAAHLKSNLSDGDRKVFEATFKLIPKPGS